MFREMRRNKQQLSDQETNAILANETSGVLALMGDDGYPYSVPLSYVYDHDKIYFHSAKSGHKIDAITSCSKASFCVIAQDEVMPEQYTTYFKSVIVFGQIRILTEEKEIYEAIIKLASKYHPSAAIAAHNQEIDAYKNNLYMLEMTIKHMSGKAAKEIS